MDSHGREEQMLGFKTPPASARRQQGPGAAQTVPGLSVARGLRAASLSLNSEDGVEDCFAVYKAHRYTE